MIVDEQAAEPHMMLTAAARIVRAFVMTPHKMRHARGMDGTRRVAQRLCLATCTSGSNAICSLMRMQSWDVQPTAAAFDLLLATLSQA